MADEGAAAELAPGTRALGRRMGPVKSSSSHVFAFFGLPYAAPPVGPLRFEPPKPADLWTGDRDATKHGAVSLQNMPMWEKLPGLFKLKTPSVMSEDCLFLNIWTQSLKSDAKKPVMVFIHGGGFDAGYSDLYYGTSLVSLGDVVLVTINYRLNVFGFMTTGDDVITGNYGILDQIEALKWVKKNVSAFGGDPDNVTIFGESAGAMSVAALLLTKYSTGLFHRAICQSGTMHAPWVFPTALKAGSANKPLIQKLGCDSENKNEILEFLRAVPAEELFKATGPTCRFMPVIDGDIFRAEDICAEENSIHPDVDVIIGLNNHEGALMAQMISAMTFPNLDSVLKATGMFVNKAFGDEGAAVSSAMVQEYFDNVTSDEQRAMTYVEMIRDYLYTIGSVKTAQVQARSSGRTYMYWYQYREPSTQYPEWVGADHMAELQVVFGYRLMKDDISEQLDGLHTCEESLESEQLSRTVIALWTNFAKKGNPNDDGLPEWPQYQLSTKEHIVIDSTFSTGRDMLKDKIDFWENLLVKHPPPYKR